MSFGKISFTGCLMWQESGLVAQYFSLLLHLCLILFAIESLLREILQSLFFEDFYYHSNFVESQINHAGKTCLDSKRKLPCSSRTVLSKCQITSSNKPHEQIYEFQLAF